MVNAMAEWALFLRRILTTLAFGVFGGVFITLMTHGAVGFAAPNWHSDGQYGLFLVFLYMFGASIGVLVSFYFWPPLLLKPMRIRTLGNTAGIILGGIMSLIAPVLIMRLIHFLM